MNLSYLHILFIVTFSGVTWFISHIYVCLPFPLPVVVLCVMLTDFCVYYRLFCVHGRPSWVNTAYTMCCIKEMPFARILGELVTCRELFYYFPRFKL